MAAVDVGLPLMILHPARGATGTPTRKTKQKQRHWAEYVKFLKAAHFNTLIKAVAHTHLGSGGWSSF